MLMLRLGVIVLFIGAVACGDDDDTSSPDGGGDASIEKDAGEDADAAVDSGTATDLKDFAIAKADTPCKTNDQKACVDHNGTERLVCVSGTWKKSATAPACTGNNRCDTKLGSTQGTCLAIPAECVGKKPGDQVCDGTARKKCDQDLLHYQDDACGGDHLTCSKTDGVKCICESGYADDNGTCKAIPGCENKPCGDSPNTCGEASDGFSCTCGTGYTGTGSKSCEDVNECATANGGCDALTTCTNTKGGRTCSACPTGYTGDGASGCDDINECATDNGGCTADHAVCTNTPGARTCGCPTGYTGNGIADCTDINECDTDNGGCDGMVSCTNTDGGRTCGACPMYYVGTGETSCTHVHTFEFGTVMEERPQSVATDSSGNIYVAGYTSGAFDNNTSAGNYDLFVVKYNATGVIQWVQQLGTAAAEFAYGVGVDSDGNVYVGGTTEDDLDGQTSAGAQDVFLVKYNSAGVKQWTREYGSPGIDYGLGITTTAAGDTYIAAAFADDTDDTTNTGGSDAAVLKYDASGALIWAKQFGTTADDYAYGITADSSNVYVTGTTTGDLDGANHGGSDIFVRKYDAAGAEAWTDQLGSDATDYAHGVATDTNGNVFVAGSASGDFDGNTGAGAFDVILVKWDGTGAKQWSRQIGSGNYDYGQAVVTDSSGAAYVVGYSETDFDGHTSLGGTDVVALKYDGAGNKVWSRQIGTSTTDIGSNLAIQGGNLFITGSTLGTLEDQTNAGSYDGFVTKYDGSGNQL
jgi:hypothetical protein